MAIAITIIYAFHQFSVGHPPPPPMTLMHQSHDSCHGEVMQDYCIYLQTCTTQLLDLSRTSWFININFVLFLAIYITIVNFLPSTCLQIY